MFSSSSNLFLILFRNIRLYLFEFLSNYSFHIIFKVLYLFRSLALSLNLKFGFFVILWFAHLAGAISLKNGGKKGRGKFQ